MLSALLVGAALVPLAACTPDAPLPSGSASPTASSEQSARPSPSVGPTESASPSATAAAPDDPGGTDEPPVLNATPVISIAAVSTLNGNIIFGGYVAGIVESGGECVYQLVDDAQHKTVAAETVGEPNTDTTSCGSPEVPSGQVASGTYSVVLVYSNELGSASSSPVTLEVP